MVSAPVAGAMEEAQEMLKFHKGLVQSLGDDLQKCEKRLEKVTTVSIEQERQIDSQQAMIDILRCAKKHLRDKVGGLKERLTLSEQRVVELIDAVKSFRGKNIANAEPTVDLSGIVKDALIEHLESEVATLTKDSLEHDERFEAFKFRYEQKMKQDKAEYDQHVAALEAEAKLQSEALSDERVLNVKLTSHLANVTRENRSFQDKLARQADTVETKTESRSKQLKDAMAYTVSLANSDCEQREGKEVEIYQLFTLCRLAGSQEAEIVQLRAENSLLKDESESSSAQPAKFLPSTITPPKYPKRSKRNLLSLQVKTVDGEQSPPGPHSAPAGPLTPDSPATSSTVSISSERQLLDCKLRESNGVQEPGVEAEQLREQLAVAQEAAIRHQHEKEALRGKVRCLNKQLSEFVGTVPSKGGDERIGKTLEISVHSPPLHPHRSKRYGRDVSDLTDKVKAFEDEQIRLSARSKEGIETANPLPVAPSFIVSAECERVFRELPFNY